MSVSREEMLIEANRRGLLKGEQKAQFDEAVRRGLINVGESQNAERPNLLGPQRGAVASALGRVGENAAGSFVANLLSIPNASGELLKAGGSAIEAGAGGLLAKVMGQPANLSERYAVAQAKSPPVSSLLLKIPDPDTSDVLTAARSIPSVLSGYAVEGDATNVPRLTEALRGMAKARASQTASDEQNPAATATGRTIGDIATMLTLRPSARIAALTRGSEEAPVVAEAASGLNAAARKVAGGLGKSAEAGFDGAVMAALGDGDPLKTAAYSAGAQAAGSAALEAKGYLMRNPLKSFATLFLAHQMWKSVLPGSQNVFESQDQAINELVGAYSLGVLASAAGAGRPTGLLANALSSASRSGIASVITQLQEADKQGQSEYDRVLGKMTEDPDYFGREVRAKLEQAANSDKPRALLDAIDQYMQSSWFKQKYDALTEPEPDDSKKKLANPNEASIVPQLPLRMSPDSVFNKPLPMEGRAALLPLRRTDWPMMGNREWALPGVLAAAINAVTAPGRSLHGTEPFDAPSEALNFASTFASGGLGASRLAEVPSGSLGMNAWHGSPHKFDAFDISKIGTGEGAQAYGHGLYFAENPQVAASYREALSGQLGSPSNEILIDGNKIENLSDDMRRAYEIIARDGRRNAQGTAADLEAQGLDASNIRAALAASRGKTVSLNRNPGSLYHVDIPDEAIAKMLDWDKPLSEQPESVRIALSAMARDLEDVDSFEFPALAVLRGGRHPRDKNYSPTGEHIFSELSHAMGQHANSAEISAALRSRGIPGIRYLDAGSRGAGGKGTSNFVLFDDKLAKIIKRE